MGQDWMLLNLDEEWDTGSGGKLGEFFTHSGLHIHIKHFTIPIWSEERIKRYKAKFPRVAHQSKSSSKLLKLPAELISIVLLYLRNDLHDLVCFALADGRLFEIALPVVIDVHKLCSASWAGDRVICIGNYAQTDDVPASLEQYVSDLVAKWRKLDKANEEICRWDFVSAARETFLQVHDFGIYRRDWEFLDELAQDSGAYNELLKPNYAAPHPWVLRNLSKKEYVRAEAITELTGCKTYGPFHNGPIDLGHALLSQICWSWDSGTAMNYDGDLHRGQWAGDRFDVTTIDQLKSSDEWQDISEEVMQRLDDIWKGEKGRDWKDQLMRGELTWVQRIEFV